MNDRSFLVTSVLAAGIVLGTHGVTTSAQTATSSSWNAQRTPWGDPDLQGMWTNATATPLERPEELEGKQVLTNEELAERDRQVAQVNSTDNPPPAGDPGSHNEFWRERGGLVKRTSLLVDPPDGKLPPLTREAQNSRDRLAETRITNPADGPESRNLFERCITRGLPGAMMGDFYNHNNNILQAPGYVVISVEMIHHARVIPLDGRPHLDQQIRQWLGDSRGRWEGDTLIVETTNFDNVGARRINSMLGVIVFSTSATARVIERFTRLDVETIDYQVTVDDPATYTRPWTAAIPMTKLQGTLFEFACHEGNRGMVGILAGTRAEEKAAEAATVANLDLALQPPDTRGRDRCRASGPARSPCRKCSAGAPTRAIPSRRPSSGAGTTRAEAWSRTMRKRCNGCGGPPCPAVRCWQSCGWTWLPPGRWTNPRGASICRSKMRSPTPSVGLRSGGLHGESETKTAADV